MDKESKKNERRAERLFLEAYDSHAERILRHASFRVSDQNAAQDIASETFLKAWDYARSNEVKNFKSFLYRIADNLIIDHYRAKKYQPIPIESIDVDKIADQTDLPAETDRALAHATVKMHLQSLPEDHRTLLVYRYIDELDMTTIRKLTGKSLTNIYVTIHRALKSLKEKITKNNGNEKYEK